MADEIHVATRELVERAIENDPGGVLATFAEFSALDGDPTNLTTGSSRRFLILEALDMFTTTDVLRDQRDDEDDFRKRLRIRLELVTYMLYWEAHLVQRWVSSLVALVQGERYNPVRYDPPAGTKRPGTKQIFDETRKAASLCNPPLTALTTFLDARYSNQLRNAVAHTQFMITGQVVSLDNHNPRDPRSIPSVGFEAWEEWFSDVRSFAQSIMRLRSKTLAEHAGRITPFDYEIPSTTVGHAQIGTDDRGEWTAEPRSMPADR